MLQEEEVQDPSGRYTRRGLIGSGAHKAVYKAYDEEEGLEVAWNQIRLGSFKDPEKRAKVHSEIAILEQLHHQNIINIYDAFETKDKNYIVFITEIMTSGTLREFIASAGKIRLKIVKNWCKQILRGLAYLHSHSPPVVHRDLKCDNIFMNGNRGEVKIGDLGLSIILEDKSHAVSVLGTPEFMAPEIYDEKYTSKVDTYSFGMCVLEMVTGKTPYSECENPAQIYRRVTLKKKPEGLNLIEYDDVRDFILMCIEFDPEKRPTAQEVLESPFLQSDDNDKRVFFMPETLTSSPSQQVDLPAISGEETPKSPTENNSIQGEETEKEIQDQDQEEDLTGSSPRFTSDSTFNLDDDDQGGKRVYVVDPNIDENTTEVKMKLSLDGEGVCREVEFTFNLEQDTATEVAEEMVSEIGLTQEDAEDIAEMIDEKLEGIKAGYMVDESMDIDIEDEEVDSVSHSPRDKLSISVFFPHHDGDEEHEEGEDENSSGNLSADTVKSFHSNPNILSPIEEDDFQRAISRNTQKKHSAQSAPNSEPTSLATSPKQLVDDGPSSAPADNGPGNYSMDRRFNIDNAKDIFDNSDISVQTGQNQTDTSFEDVQQGNVPSPKRSVSPDIVQTVDNAQLEKLDERFNSLADSEKREYLAMLKRQEKERNQLRQRHSGETERFFQDIKHRAAQTSPEKNSTEEDSEDTHPQKQEIKSYHQSVSHSSSRSSNSNSNHLQVDDFSLRSRSNSEGSRKTDDGVPNSFRNVDQSLHPGSAGSSSSGDSNHSQTLTAMMDQQFSEFERNNLSVASNTNSAPESSNAVSKPRPITSSKRTQHSPPPRSWNSEPSDMVLGNRVPTSSYSNHFRLDTGKTT